MGIYLLFFCHASTSICYPMVHVLLDEPTPQRLFCAIVHALLLILISIIAIVMLLLLLILLHCLMLLLLFMHFYRFWFLLFILFLLFIVEQLQLLFMHWYWFWSCRSWLLGQCYSFILLIIYILIYLCVFWPDLQVTTIRSMLFVHYCWS